MGSIGWLAISDLHVGAPSSLWQQAEDEFLRDLERVHKHVGPIDLVFCTGDVVEGGTAAQFEALTDKLSAIFKELRSLGSQPGFVVVPGNHDLVRADERTPGYRTLVAWSHDADLRSTVFWHDTHGKPLRDLVRTSFENMTAWLTEFRKTFPLPSDWTLTENGLLPGDFALTARSSDLTLGLVGLNSAFLQVVGRAQRGTVAVHPHQVHHLVGDPHAWADRHDACLLLTHHPPDWFTPDALPLYQGALFRPDVFAAHFAGHKHEPEVSSPSTPQRLFQIPSLLGLETWTGTHAPESMRTHGYWAGRLSVDESRRTSLRIWPRVTQVHKASGQRVRLIPNHAEFELDDDNAFTVDLGQRPSLPPARSLRFPSLRGEQIAKAQSVHKETASPASAAPPASPSPAVDKGTHTPNATDAPDDNDDPEPPGLGYSARWYVPNEAKEQLILGTLRHAGAPVVVTAPPFSGKTTVLQCIVSKLRAEHTGGREKCLVLLIDLGSVGESTLGDPPAFFLELAHMLVDGYERGLREAGEAVPNDIDTWVEYAWKRPISPEARLTNLVEKRILGRDRDRLVLAVDRADRFVGKACGDPMARMLRQWVRTGSLGDELWSQFRLALAVAGSALYFYAPDAVSELFASATHVRIESFSLPDVRRLAALYGSRWSDDELRKIVELAGGQPYLCRMILFLERTGVYKTDLLDIDRLKTEHCATLLRQVWLRVAEQPDLRKPLCLLLRDPTTKLSTDEYHRLYQAGLVRRESGAYLVPNQLVASYFKEQC
ncbi:MAG: AAA-like domain-containing protein [Polyangiaceae bacterium]|nr:AAA-like domain-containing protein [Polyangiaceae bacterium]